MMNRFSGNFIAAGIIAAFLTLSCSSAGEFVPREGDLAFVLAGESAFSGAITAATASQDSLKFDHVAIIGVEDGVPYVVEAAGQGVVRRTWSEFLASAPSVGGRPGIVVKRVTADFPVHESVLAAESHVGEPYDWYYLPDNGRMYCSELVYESFRYQDGSPVFSAYPMNFRDADGEMPAFWTELFASLGEPVPEGMPGTNPSDMSKEPVLQEVHRYFR